MLTRLLIRNLKRFEDVDIELGKSVVLIGPNNSGKTTALQALALWSIGLQRWTEKRAEKPPAEKRSGVTINRNDLMSIPIPTANLLWRNLHVRDVQNSGGKQQTKNVRIDVTVEGVTDGKSWQCGLEFDYTNAESLYCRPLRLTEGRQPERVEVPKEAQGVKVAFLPPMSGLAAVEPKWERGRIDVLLGEAQTAQVLRNLCYQIYSETQSEGDWEDLTGRIKELFGVTILPPEYVKQRGEITMAYRQDKIQLDISSAGRGLQQTLLLLTHLYANPGTILLLDEPDAHLEVLRQRQTYQLINEIAERTGSQIVAASHSEVILNEAADYGIVIAFVGKPHRINDRGHQIMKSLSSIGFDHYYQAEETGWVLYLEGPSDLANLRALAKTLEHEALDELDRPFVHYVTNEPSKAREHFYGLREACPNLVGIAIFDHLDPTKLQTQPALVEVMWRRRELENYFCAEDVLLAYARGDSGDNLFDSADARNREEVMKSCIARIVEAQQTLRKPSPWSADVKASDDFLDLLFEDYFEKLGTTNMLRKSNYHELARLISKEKIDPEVVDKLDLILETAHKAKAVSK
jgi:energy-coupling factor transporter ATP-binding protein EcfA2